MSQFKPLERWRFLDGKKAGKISLMRDIQRYVDPSDESLVREGSEIDDVLFDSTAVLALENYTLKSLADVMNPFEPFFSFDGSGLDSEEKKEALLKWESENNKRLFKFIIDSGYYSSLIQDKLNFDLYGFCGMFFYRRGNRMGIRTESPFDIVFAVDSYQEGFVDAYWLIEYELHTLLTLHPEAREAIPEKKENKGTYTILCALTPNTEDFIKNPEKGRKEAFVWTRYLVSNASYLRSSNNDRPSISKAPAMGKDMLELGERQYYKTSPLVICRDVKYSKKPYGAGRGKRLLVTAQNLNQLKQDTLNVSGIYGDPPYSIPLDLVDQFNSGAVDIGRGARVPVSIANQEIKPLAAPGINYQAQIELMQFEDGKIHQSLPDNPMITKTARQSQFEVDQNLQQSMKLDLIFKMLYLQQGVAEHLNQMYRIALDVKAIDPLPEILNKDEVRPGLSDLLLRDFKKAKSQGYVHALTMSQGFLSVFQEGFDNYDKDGIIRDVMTSVGGRDRLLDLEQVKKIRNERNAARQAQQQYEQQLALMEARSNSVVAGAQAEKFRAEAARAASG